MCVCYVIYLCEWPFTLHNTLCFQLPFDINIITHFLSPFMLGFLHPSCCILFLSRIIISSQQGHVHRTYRFICFSALSFLCMDSAVRFYLLKHFGKKASCLNSISDCFKTVHKPPQCPSGSVRARWSKNSTLRPTGPNLFPFSPDSRVGTSRACVHFLDHR